MKNGKAVSTAIEQQQLADDLAVATKFIHVDNQRPTSIAPAVRDDSIRGSCNENRGHVSGEHYRGSVNTSNASANAELSNVYLPIVPVTVNGNPRTY